MNRRHLIVASGIAGAMYSGLVRSALPCPPPQLDVEGGGSATTPCPVGTEYSTTFPLTENPISEAGVWHYTASAAVQTPVRSEVLNGVHVAHGTQVNPNGTSYDDSSAYLTGFGTDYEVEGTIWMAASQTGYHKEVEILLRWTDTGSLRSTPYGNTNSNGYEINVNYDGGYWNLGRFKGAALVSGAFNNSAQTGDKFRARIEGQRIRAWWNNVLFIDHTDNDALKITTGNPGIGFFVNNAPNNQFGFSAVTITAL